MTSAEWIEKAKQSENVLLSLLDNYHPSVLTPANPQEFNSTLFSAPGAEQACEVIRGKIREEHLGNATEQFKTALSEGDVQTCGSLLNSAWFGVPESTSCWRITGFKEAVELLEDPPDDIDYSEEE
jgi:hypothetical protein